MLAKLISWFKLYISKGKIKSTWEKELPERFVAGATVATTFTGEQLAQARRSVSAQLDAFVQSHINGN